MWQHTDVSQNGFNNAKESAAAAAAAGVHLVSIPGRVGEGLFVSFRLNFFYLLFVTYS